MHWIFFMITLCQCPPMETVPTKEVGVGKALTRIKVQVKFPDGHLVWTPVINGYLPTICDVVVNQTLITREYDFSKTILLPQDLPAIIAYRHGKPVPSVEEISERPDGRGGIVRRVTRYDTYVYEPDFLGQQEEKIVLPPPDDLLKRPSQIPKP